MTVRTDPAAGEASFEALRLEAYERLGDARELLGEPTGPRSPAQARLVREAVSFIAAARAALLKAGQS